MWLSWSLLIVYLACVQQIHIAANGETAIVCIKCLEDNPRNFTLMTQICTSQHPSHSDSRQVRVWKWRKNREGILEIYPSVHDKPAVRPRPMFLKFSGKFKLCRKATSNGCRKRDCNYAHSVEEMERWNAIKAQNKSRQASQKTPGTVRCTYTCMQCGLLKFHTIIIILNMHAYNIYITVCFIAIVSKS